MARNFRINISTTAGALEGTWYASVPVDVQGCTAAQAATAILAGGYASSGMFPVSGLAGEAHFFAGEIVLSGGEVWDGTYALTSLPVNIAPTSPSLRGTFAGTNSTTLCGIGLNNTGALATVLVTTGDPTTVAYSIPGSPSIVDLGLHLLDAEIASQGSTLKDLYISGTYNLALWYYNPSTNHYKLAGSDPGAPWTLAVEDPIPTITSVERFSVYTDSVGSALLAPAAGCAGTIITITGTDFGDGAGVTVGGIPATSVTVVDQTTITAVVGTHADGVVDVIVINADGTSVTEVGGYEYLTPWWERTLTVISDGVPYTEIIYTNSCSAPSSGVWELSGDPGDPPDYTTDPDGWFVSSAAYTGNVWVEIDNGPPTYARKWSQISAWATADTGMLGGSPAASCVYENRLLYPGGNYTVGTDYPPIRVCNGVFDHEVCRLPPTTSDTIPKAVLSMLAANGTVYLSTFDSGTTSADWRGRVFQLDLDSGVLTPIGAQFAAGEMPYALTWHMGRLWCGTNNGIGTVGKIYYFRPGIDTAWTEDYATTTSSAGGVDSLCSYKGKLYVGTDNAAAARGKVLVRDSAGAYTTSLTGTGGTAVVNNGYLALTEFGGNLYASYWNNDGTPIAKIEKFDGSSWSTAYTGAAGTLRPFILLLNDNGVLYAAGGGKLLSSVILTTADGTTWTNRTANLPESNRTLLPMTGVLVL